MPTTRGRGFYYYLYENGLTYQFASLLIGIESLAWYGASGCKSYIRESLSKGAELNL